MNGLEFALRQLLKNPGFTAVACLCVSARRQAVLTLALGIGLLAFVALAACWFPARRAASVNPIEALRTE